MSFAATGIYTGPTGAINATPGTVIRSATWNTINADLAAALTQLAQQAWTPSTSTVAASPYTVLASDAALVFNVSGSCTVTLPTPSSNQGRWLRVKTVTAQTVVSASSNVAPQTATTPGTAILAGTAGKWAAMQSDGANWIVMLSN